MLDGQKANPLDLLGQAERGGTLALEKRFRADPFDLLGQGERWPVSVTLPGQVEPKFEINWNSFHQNFLSGMPVFFKRADLAKNALAVQVFRDCRIERRIPRQAIIAAALVHIAAMILPWPELPAALKHNPAFDNAELTWSGPINDLPLLKALRPKPSPAAAKPPAPTEGTEAYHPRQRIYTDPARPNHPRQTLINPAAPPNAPKILPNLPNIVQLASTAGPARPRLEISEQTLAKLRPKQTRKAATAAVAPDLPNMEEHSADMNLAAIAEQPARPKLQINASSTPRAAVQAQKSDTIAPEVATGNTGNSGTSLIALSAAPAPPAPVSPVPQGNLAARVAMSPEGKPGASGEGIAGGEAGGGGGKNSVGISITGGNPQPNNNASGLGGAGKLTLPKSAMIKRPDPDASTEEPPERTGPPNFGALPPGAKPEQIFSSKRVYTMNVNMPNLNSATGSWIIRFSELHLDRMHRPSDNVSAPIPVRKVDPKYPPTLIEEHVEGEVILYGVIRQNGKVDSIQVVHSIDEQLDANAMAAFSEWKFEPATKDGQPVDLEAIVRIPFRTPSRREAQ